MMTESNDNLGRIKRGSLLADACKFLNVALPDITVTADVDVVDDWINRHVINPDPSILRSTTIPLGFDTETKPYGRHLDMSQIGRAPPALMQLAVDDSILLVRLLHIDKVGMSVKLDFIATPALKKTLTSSAAMKIGFNMKHEEEELSKCYNLKLSEVCDLSNICCGLTASCKTNLNIVFNKKEIFDIRVSNWEAHQLTQEQIDYAATDAWLSLKVYEKLCKMGLISSQFSMYPALCNKKDKVLKKLQLQEIRRFEDYKGWLIYLKDCDIPLSKIDDSLREEHKARCKRYMEAERMSDTTESQN